MIGTFAGMYLFSYSIDNLSLMAMTISVGFVVDDAIVMLENIYRHMEDGMDPMEASLIGSQEIGFTIISMSLSLVAVFIPPHLLMGGIIGRRLFHEFAVTVSLTILISGVVSLTMAPMLCSRFLRADHGAHGKVYLAVENGFNAMFNFYTRTLDIAFRHQRTVFSIFLATIALSVVLYIMVPKGFFPQQDIGLLSGVTEGAQDISFAEMDRLQDMAREIIGLRDPDIENVGSTMGFGGQSMNIGRIMALLKPHRERTANADEIIGRLRPAARQDPRHAVYLQSAPGHHHRRPRHPHQYQYTLQDVDYRELGDWSAQAHRRHGRHARAARRGQRHAGWRHHRHADHRPRPGRALRHPAATDRRHPLRRFRPAPGGPVLHPGEYIPDHPGGSASTAGRSAHARQDLRQGHHRTVRRCRCRPSSSWTPNR